MLHDLVLLDCQLVASPTSTTCDTAGLMVEIVPKQILAVPVVLLCVQDMMMPYFINLL